MSYSFKKALFELAPLWFCFFLPFGNSLLSGIMVAWVTTSLLNLNRGHFIAGIRNPGFWLMTSLFALTCLSAVFSSNKVEALNAVEIKLSFIFCPYLIFCFRWPVEVLKRWVLSFVSGCFFACLYLIIRATYFAVMGEPQYFFYSQFSDFIHASYFAMYLTLAILLVIILYPAWFKSHQRILYLSYFYVVVFIITIFLCSSKMGLIGFFISALLLLAYKIRLSVKPKRLLLVLCGTVIFLLPAPWLFPTPFQRLLSLRNVTLDRIDKTSSESTTVRMLIWKEALNISSANLIAGTGVGDANDALYQAYEKNGLTGALEHKLNAHNQYLQTLIGMGLLGLAVLLALTLGQTIRSLIKRHFLFFVFSLIITLNFFVESMLQTSAGVLYFTFFFCFFSVVNEKQLLGE